MKMSLVRLKKCVWISIPLDFVPGSGSLCNHEKIFLQKRNWEDKRELLLVSKLFKPYMMA